jgi:hypothetical protein
VTYRSRLEPESFRSPLSACIALIESRFFNWLIGDAADPSDTTPSQADSPVQEAPPSPRARRNTEPLTEVLTRRLQAAGEHARIVRVLWYTCEPVPSPAPGQVVRLVPPDEADGGAGLVLAMARDALQLAEQRACEHLLIASDDDRLLATIDAVQGKGVRVHALADESAADLPLLAQSDPNWASLLRQVDSRLIWAEADAAAPAGAVPAEPFRRQHGERERWGARPRGFGAGSSFGEAEAVHAQAVMDTVQGWLADLTPAMWADIAAQLPLQRGLPQEADRELLQRLSQRLGRTVSVPERKLMRERARQGLEAQQEAAVPMAAAAD